MKEKKTNALVIWMHIFAGISIIWGFAEGVIGEIGAITSIQQTVIALWQIKYLLYAILFELVALNFKR